MWCSELAAYPTANFCECGGEGILPQTFCAATAAVVALLLSSLNGRVHVQNERAFTAMECNASLLFQTVLFFLPLSSERAAVFFFIFLLWKNVIALSVKICQRACCFMPLIVSADALGAKGIRFFFFIFFVQRCSSEALALHTRCHFEPMGETFGGIITALVECNQKQII